MKTKKLIKISNINKKKVYDIQIDLKKEKFLYNENNFIVNNTVVHNSHAGGFIVSSDNVNENIFIAKSSKDYVTGWQETGAVKELEPNGFIKIDILGLNCVEQIKRCVDEVNKKHPDKKISDPYSLPVDDPKVYEFINTLQLENVFQMESKVFKDAVKKIKPKTLQDISNISTLIRPGSADVDDYVDAGDEIRREPKCLKYIYDQTRGLMIYQEQLMQVLMELGSFNIFEADKVRRLIRKIGKEKTAEDSRQAMITESDTYRKKYLEKAIKKITEEDSWTKKEAEEYAQLQWDAIMAQAKYCLEENELITLANGKKKKVKNLKIGDVIIAFTGGKFKEVPVIQKHDNGFAEVYEVKTNKGTTIRCTGNHKFLTKLGLKTLLEIWNEKLEILEKEDV
jgi:DNA polymerase III alpha subunit